LGKWFNKRNDFLSLGLPVTIKIQGEMYSGKIAALKSWSFTVALDAFRVPVNLRRGDAVQVFYLAAREVYQFPSYIKAVKAKKKILAHLELFGDCEHGR